MTEQHVLRAVRLPAVLGMLAVLTACAQPKSLYSWEAYQPAVYGYLKDDGADPTAQLQILEKNVETARARNQALPPGFRAQLGMLYLKQGQADRAFAQFEGEKNAFPEATPFMNFLMRSQPTPAAQVESGSRRDGVIATPHVAHGG